MFEQSLMQLSSDNTSRKRLTVLVSYLLEGLVVLSLLSFPLVRTDAIALNDTPTAHPPTRYVPQHVDLVSTPTSSRTTPRQAPINVFQFPAHIPRNIDRTPDPSTSEIAAPSDGIPVTDPREQNAVLQSMLHSPATNPIHHPTLVPRPSRAEESLLVRQIKPAYPPLALQARIEGPVVLQAVIARDGTIQHLEVVSGHPLLVRAAVDAVRQWRYRPFLLDGDPVEVETQITVNFTMSHN